MGIGLALPARYAFFAETASRAVLLTRRGEMHEDPIVFAIRDSRSYLAAAVAIAAVALATGKIL
ncbi:MAG: hypothetical protein AAGA33_03710 [Pseudomonadota bacterium]